jgi:exodeoxyribonuclease-3
MERATLRLLTWNIRAGGGTRLARIAAALAVHAADVLVLTEYRSGEAGKALRAVLRDQGYVWCSPVEPPGTRNGVLIATKTKPRALAHVTPHVPEPWRMLTLTIGGIRLFGIYMPNLKAKIPYWEALIEAAGPQAARRVLALGDFNTCRAFLDETGATDVTAPFLDKMLDAGMRDAWRERFPDGREYSWYSHRGNGFRLDHAFASDAMTRRILSVRYSHDERTAGLSDHSALLVDIKTNASRPATAIVSIMPPSHSRADATAVPDGARILAQSASDGPHQIPP